MASNRDHWGVGNGLHARLDLSRRDDQCRVRTRNGAWVHSIFTRLANDAAAMKYFSISNG